MTARITMVTMLMALVSMVTSGCCQQTPGDKVRARQAVTPRAATKKPATAQIHMTGFIVHNPVSGQDIHVDLTAAGGNGVAILANNPIRLPYEIILDVFHDVEGRLHDYDVFASRDPKQDPYLNIEIKTSDATPEVTCGWIIVVGRWPLAQTKWVSGSAPGSGFVVRIENNPDPNLVRHYVYNIHSTSVVNVEWLGHDEFVTVPPGMYVVFKADTSTLPTPQHNKGVKFLDYVRSRAAIAGFSLNPQE
ncbi:MAG: hypothetical protein ABIG44_07175 [Planctomycetota bacterium]